MPNCAKGQYASTNWSVTMANPSHFLMGGRGSPHFHGANDIFALRWGSKLHVFWGIKHDVIMDVNLKSIKAYNIGKIPGWVLKPTSFSVNLLLCTFIWNVKSGVSTSLTLPEFFDWQRAPHKLCGPSLSDRRDGDRSQKPRSTSGLCPWSQIWCSPSERFKQPINRLFLFLCPQCN